jgi:hypothetical protein
MTAMLVGLGAVCVVAAAAGGGVKWAGGELPALQSTLRQVLVALVGVGLGSVGFVIDDGSALRVAGGGDEGTTTSTTTTTATTTSIPTTASTSIPVTVPATPTTPTTETTVTAALALSSDKGRSGTTFRVTGTNFQPGEKVEIRFAGLLLGTAQADENGTFVEFEAKVPSTRNLPNGQRQVEVTATGQASARTASRPFEVLVISIPTTLPFP